MSKQNEAGAALPSAQQLGRRALSLGTANAFDYAMQFLLPVVLVRCLVEADFGEYRLLWLAVGTVMAVAPMAMPGGSLYYFLPRSDAPTGRLYINQALLFLSVSGLIAAWAVSPWNPWLPEKLGVLASHGALVPVFIALWVIAAPLDSLPLVDERVSWQAKRIIILSAIRGAGLSLAAFLTQDFGYVLLALLAFVLLRIVVLLKYLALHHAEQAPILRWRAFADQVSYAAPIGAAGALYGLRTQADQWVAAALFSLGQFAAFSIASVLGSLMNLFRLSVNYAFLPSMSRLEAAGDIPGLLRLNGQANAMVATLVCPLFAFVFVFAEEIVTLIYTGTYIDAAPVMRIYIAGLAPLVIELSTVTMLLRLAPFVMGVNLVTLMLAVPLNWIFAQRIGLAGAAVGTVATIYLDRIVTLWCIARRTGVPLRQLQDWRAIGEPMLFSVLAAAFAWSLVSRIPAAIAPPAGAALGGVLLIAAYAAMQGLLRTRRWRART